MAPVPLEESVPIWNPGAGGARRTCLSDQLLPVGLSFDRNPAATSDRRSLVPEPLMHQQLRCAWNDISLQLSDHLVSEAFIQLARPRVERRNTQENVPGVSSREFLGKLEQLRSHCGASTAWIYPNRAYVRRARHAVRIEQKKAVRLTMVVVGDEQQI